MTPLPNFPVQTLFLQEGTWEKASAAVQEGGELPGGRHCHQALPGLQVPEVYQVTKGHSWSSYKLKSSE